MVFVSISLKILVGKILFLGICLITSVGKILLKMLGIFCNNVTWENSWILVKFLNCYLGKFCLGIWVNFLKVLSWENLVKVGKILFGKILSEKIGNIFSGKIVLPIFVEKSWENIIWKILNILLGKFY